MIRPSCRSMLLQSMLRGVAVFTWEPPEMQGIRCNIVQHEVGGFLRVEASLTC